MVGGGNAAGVVGSRSIGVTFRTSRGVADGTIDRQLPILGRDNGPARRDQREMVQAEAHRVRTAVASHAASPVNCTRTIGLWAMAASNDTALR